METPAFNRVVVDIGGTNFRIARASGRTLTEVESYPCSEFDGIAVALKFYLDSHQLDNVMLCLAVAGPVTGEQIEMTNLDWKFSRKELADELGLQELFVINDYTAVAMSVPVLSAADKKQIGAGSAMADAPIAVCGPGTGLGVSHLVCHNEHWLALPGEGGHVDFAQADEMEQEIYNIYRRRFSHVSSERILSGPGLVELYQAVCEIKGVVAAPLSARQISSNAVSGNCAFCQESLNRFCAILGSFCGNLALTMSTFGGVYIAGGMVPHFLDFFEKSEFRKRFEAKGRYEKYNASIPTYVITVNDPGLYGAALYLQQAMPE